ncbi:protocatechuate 3,4-dioxygenase [Rhodovarius crocodyli]|uniref:Protocatechuate 3,4-dioxygenase n=1 Tax=Rhodovarius crocodyli TaxID=1979269 RepID=A0A437MME4_9PROT|nr:protocatechuate 3,4-dioxygenase [Rhodovarius crocodyli]RVT98805.1 protocatechuate 3,4-dioxygenase [Rhodovarius crocodyli]
MARIIGGIGISHSPAAIFAHDNGHAEKPEWQGFFQPLARVREWVRQAAPDLIVVVFNDHLNHFFFDAYPTLAMGVAPEYPLAPEGGAWLPFPPVPGHPAAAQLAAALLERDFDLTLCQELAFDHGAAGPLRLVGEPWAAPVVPIVVNTLRAPMPRPARLFALGRALREAIAELPEDMRVLVVGTGGLSHALDGPTAGHIAQDWDRDFLARMVDDPASLAARSLADYEAGAGSEGLESMMWLVMRGALPERVSPLLSAYHPFGVTGLGLLLLEP